LPYSMASDQPIGEAGRKARTARADARAAELAPVIAELQGAGVTSLHAIATVFNARGIPAARGGKWKAVQVRRVLGVDRQLGLGNAQKLGLHNLTSG